MLKTWFICFLITCECPFWPVVQMHAQPSPGIGTIFDFISCELDFQCIFKSIEKFCEILFIFLCLIFSLIKYRTWFHKITGPCAEWRWFILLHPSRTMGLIGINFRSDGFSCCPLTFRHFYPESKGWLFFFVSRVFWLFAALENFFLAKVRLKRIWGDLLMSFFTFTVLCPVRFINQKLDRSNFLFTNLSNFDLG